MLPDERFFSFVISPGAKGFEVITTHKATGRELKRRCGFHEVEKTKIGPCAA